MPKILAVPSELMHPERDCQVVIDAIDDGGGICRTITASISMVSVMNCCGIKHHGKPAVLVIWKREK